MPCSIACKWKPRSGESEGMVCITCHEMIATMQRDAKHVAAHDIKRLVHGPPVSDIRVVRSGKIITRQYKIVPVPKPRQTRSDKWNKRDSVMRYRQFADKVRALGIIIPPSGAKVTFVMPMPDSWSKSKKIKNNGLPHTVKPDWDNLAKALCDAIYEDDSVIWHMEIIKLWGWEGSITIEAEEHP